MTPKDMQSLANLTREYYDEIEHEFEEGDEAGDGTLEDLLTALSDVAAHLRGEGY